MSDYSDNLYLYDINNWQEYVAKILQGDRIFIKEFNKTEYIPAYVSGLAYNSYKKYIRLQYHLDWVKYCKRNADLYYVEMDDESSAQELSGELLDYLNKLKQMNRAELLEEQYNVKRGKEPEKYQLLIHVFRQYITDLEKEERVKAWADSLIGQEIVLNQNQGKVKVVATQLNSRKNAAIISVEGDIRTHYLSYKGE